MTNADIVILHPFFCLISAVSRSSTHPGWYRLSTRLSTPHVSYRLSPVRRHLMCHMYEMIIAGTRFVLPIMSFVICHECQLKFGHWVDILKKRWQKCDIRQLSIEQVLKSHFCHLFVPVCYQLSSARRRPRDVRMCCQYRRILLKVAKMQFHTCWNRIIAILLVNLQNSLVGYTDICY